ncbi:MAG: hypothetical protein KF774_17125 [Planctomyces sp.]|nr:hypothetical protein [Planctomyces sp.]
MVAGASNHLNADWADRARQQWPFLSPGDLDEIGGRVDRLYRILLKHQVSRGDAAAQLHQFMSHERRTCSCSAG